MSGHEAKASKHSREVTVAAPSADESLPVVVERLDATGRRTVLAESDDGAEVVLKTIMELAHRGVLLARYPAKELSKSLGEPFPGGLAQHIAKLFFDGVGQHESSIPPQQSSDGFAFFVDETVAGLEEEPAFTSTESAQLWTSTKQNFASHFVDGLARALHYVEGVVHDR